MVLGYGMVHSIDLGQRSAKQTPIAVTMKTLTCAQMGGMCDEKISGTTQDEMMMNGMKHLEAAHPEMAENVKKMGKDDPMMVEWQEKFQAAWDAAPTE